MTNYEDRKAKIHQKSQDDQVDIGLRALKLKEETGLPWTTIAKRFGTSAQTLSHWVKKAKED